MVKKTKKPNKNLKSKNAQKSKATPIVRKMVKKQKPKATKSKIKINIKKSKPILKSKPNNTVKTAKTPDQKAKLKEKEANARKKVNINIPQQEEAKLSIDRLLANDKAVEYLKKNVSKMAVDVVDMLVTPKQTNSLQSN